MSANNSRTKLLVIASVVLAGGIVLYFWSPRNEAAASRSARTDAGKDTMATGDSHTDAKPISSNLPDPQLPTREGGLGDFALLARERLGNKLTDSEALLLDKLYKRTVSKREQLELSLAKRDEVNANAVLITIPEYYAKGLELYSAFGDSIMSEFGKQRGQELLKELDQSIRANNYEFGQQEQQILVEDKGSSIHFVHGSGGAVQINGELRLTRTTSVSDLLKQNLLTYEYLKPLFPTSVVGAPK